jgi:hypothetical protein
MVVELGVGEGDGVGEPGEDVGVGDGVGSAGAGPGTGTAALDAMVVFPPHPTIRIRVNEAILRHSDSFTARNFPPIFDCEYFGDSIDRQSSCGIFEDLAQGDHLAHED